MLEKGCTTGQGPGPAAEEIHNMATTTIACWLSQTNRGTDLGLSSDAKMRSVSAALVDIKHNLCSGFGEVVPSQPILPKAAAW